MNNKMDRLEQVRQIVDAILIGQADLEERRCGFVHLYGVSQACALLALRRGQDAELAATAGMLHDIATYRTNDPINHAARSAAEARQVLQEIGRFSTEEIEAVCRAISRHSDKAALDDPFSELLKDADVLQHSLYNPGAGAAPIHSQAHEQRLQRVLREIGV
jgi:HD superfamily phosphodiesterase